MQKTICLKKISYLFLSIFSIFSGFGQASISATGNQAFCAGSPINIVTDFSISDPTSTTIAAFYIQISEGYQQGFDILQLDVSPHSNILSDWDPSAGKLTLSSGVIGSQMLLIDLEKAVKDVVFMTTAINIFPEKKFSLTIDDANYLPETGHFYKFISANLITWTKAKIAAENQFYYGRRGYLATLTSQIEADFAGKQASGSGWIGGSDEETEGVWKWVTGPEAGTPDEIFWNGTANGSSPNFAFWNSGEPNQRGDEDYAHITDVRVARDGRIGSWNDLQKKGGADDEYQSKGYIVEFGTPSDPPLNIVATTSIFIPQIVSSVNATICESGTATISATANEGQILWFDEAVAGDLVETGNTFTTPSLTNTTIYYVAASVNGCTTLPRTAVTVTVKPRPSIVSTTDDIVCSGTATLTATASQGEVFWYDSLVSTTPIFVGNSYVTLDLTSSTTYYVSANINGCETAIRTPVNAILDETIPDFEIPLNRYVLCEDIDSIVLQTRNPQGNYAYVWKKDDVTLSETSSSISVTSEGNYYVSAVSEAGCISDEKLIVVTKSSIATITKDDVIITDDSNNNSIQVANPNLGIGSYEFAIDDEFGNYTDVGFFQNLSPGIHTLFVRDKLGCGVASYQFSILAYPKFFTPNGDGVNDFWTINGFDTAFYTISKISIFDRFGKLIYQIEPNSQGWNGDYQGKKLPSNSYWFRVLLTDINGNTIEKSGNFSLIRK
ncbi:Ig-like domain-containing protein [Polaribacter sp.]|uniref:Ig-like domain-containing protein n=1 Tax=Polaribacter sp. TaxID=1920175 RepID=UPI0040482F86